MELGLAMKDPSSELVRRIAPLAEDRGFRSLLFPELSIVGTARITGRDPFISAAIALESTEELRAGPGVVGTVFHTPRHLALRAATLAEASGGRFILGCGVSHRAYAHEIGVDYPDSPMEHIRSYLDQLAAENERLAFGGPPAPTWLAALGDRMAAVGTELADGLLLNWIAPAWVGRTIQHLQSTVGHRPTVAVYLRVDTDEGLRRQAETYLTMFDNYARHFARQGLSSVEEIVAATGVPIDDPGVLRSRVDAYRDAGTDVLILYPADVDGTGIERFVESTDVHAVGGE